jgi:nucleoid-associated protein YgaU
MRGETLPQIAAQSDVYNDLTVWPLLYRANRDQIRDPGHIWPGQVLRIPRNLSREEIAEARRYSQDKPLR